MKEPYVRNATLGCPDAVPYSFAPIAVLQNQVAGRAYPSAELAANPFYSPDFRRAYAARLLRERGL